MKPETGLRERHGRSCEAPDGGRCSCAPSWEAFVYSKRDGKKIRRTFTGKGAKSAAKKWRVAALHELDRGTMRAPTSTTVRDEALAFMAAAGEGTVRSRDGRPFKPATLRGYRRALDLRVLPAIGPMKLSEVTAVDLQHLVDRWLAKNLDASTIRNTLMPLRAMFRHAVRRGKVAVNPTAGLELPKVEGRRDRVASPQDAATLSAAAPEKDRGLWACAFYAGLRSGELRALRWEDVDLSAGVIRVRRGWDDVAGEIEPKSRAGLRTVPIATVLREHLAAHALRTGRRDGLVFGRDAERPFNPTSVYGRAATAWKKMNAERTEGELDPVDTLTLHEARHTFASLMIAAGVNAKALSSYMGHSSITVTFDLYGHLMPGNEEQAAGLLDSYLERAAGR